MDERIKNVVLVSGSVQGVNMEVYCGSSNLKFCVLRIQYDLVTIQDVDLAQVIRAVRESETVLDFEKAIKDIWGEKEVKEVLNKYF